MRIANLRFSPEGLQQRKINELQAQKGLAAGRKRARKYFSNLGELIELEQFGSSGRIRTYNPSVNSRISSAKRCEAGTEIDEKIWELQAGVSYPLALRSVEVVTNIVTIRFRLMASPRR